MHGKHFINDLIEAHSCIGRFKQEVIEQYILQLQKQGKRLQDISA